MPYASVHMPQHMHAGLDLCCLLGGRHCLADIQITCLMRGLRGSLIPMHLF